MATLQKSTQKGKNMIDSIIVSPMTHMIVGTVVLLSNLLFLIVIGRSAWKKHAISSIGKASFILFQVVLSVQILIGIKLLDQGLGVLQLYIHYLGGLAPLGFSLLFYWLPIKSDPVQSRRLATVAVASFLFVFLTFAVGSTAEIGFESAETTSSTTQSTPLAGNPARGKALFHAYGAGAHGTNGEGVTS